MALLVSVWRWVAFGVSNDSIDLQNYYGFLEEKCSGTRKVVGDLGIKNNIL